MAVAFDASAFAAQFSVTTFTFTSAMTVGSGANRALAAFITFSAAPGTVTAHWDSAGTNQLMTLVASTSISGAGVIQGYGLIAPTSGLKDFNVTTTNTVDVSVGLLSVTGADQAAVSTTFINGNTGTGTAVINTITITSATADMVIAAYCNLTNPYSGVVSGTSIGSDSANTQASEAQRAAGAASVVATATMSGSTATWVAAGMDIAAVSVGGPPPSQPLMAQIWI